MMGSKVEFSKGDLLAVYWSEKNPKRIGQIIGKHKDYWDDTPPFYVVRFLDNNDECELGRFDTFELAEPYDPNTAFKEIL